MQEFTVGSATDFENPGHRTFSLAGMEIGVFCQGGKFYAYENVCPHRAGPVCQGRIMPRTLELLNTDRTHNSMQFSKERSHIVCPWHGLEFDIATGEHQSNPNLKLRKIDVAVIGGKVVIRLMEHNNAGRQDDAISMKMAQSSRDRVGSKAGSYNLEEAPDSPRG